MDPLRAFKVARLLGEILKPAIDAVGRAAQESAERERLSDLNEAYIHRQPEDEDVRKIRLERERAEHQIWKVAYLVWTASRPDREYYDKWLASLSSEEQGMIRAAESRYGSVVHAWSNLPEDLQSETLITSGYVAGPLEMLRQLMWLSHDEERYYEMWRKGGAEWDAFIAKIASQSEEFHHTLEAVAIMTELWKSQPEHSPRTQMPKRTPEELVAILLQHWDLQERLKQKHQAEDRVWEECVLARHLADNPAWSLDRYLSTLTRAEQSMLVMAGRRRKLGVVPWSVTLDCMPEHLRETVKAIQEQKRRSNNLSECYEKWLKGGTEWEAFVANQPPEFAEALAVLGEKRRWREVSNTKIPSKL